MRVVDNKPARGSLRWIRQAVNSHTNLLNSKIIAASRMQSGVEINWVSPLELDDYAEYRDATFLERLGINLEKIPLNEFWPRLGPQWDALGRTENGQVFLVEAKANIPEVVSPGTGASPESKALIELSLNETKKFLGVDPEISWSGKLYQYANRLAHLYLLRELNNIPTWMVFVYFIGDDDVNGPKTTDEWKAALTVAKSVLGLNKRNRFSKYVVEVFIDIKEMSDQKTH